MFLGHGHAERPTFTEGDLDGQDASACLLQDVNAALLGRYHAELGQKKPRADDRMAGQW